MENNYGKAKTSSKLVLTKGQSLQAKVLRTMANTASAVGVTLGPGGLAVVIERNEAGLPNIITKDGVTVFRNLGYADSIEHCIMETARDAAIRTATEAGDGTTTATVLSESIVRSVMAYCEKNPKISPQKVVRMLERAFTTDIEPFITAHSRKLNFSDAHDRKLLHSVAKISANGDGDLADAVIKCFEVVGDEGNVTISEQSGPSHYEVERIKGFPIGVGYEDSCARYYQLFVNDAVQQRVYLEKPVFIIYHGTVTEIQTVAPLLQAIGEAWQTQGFAHNVVLVATGFSDSVLANLAMNFVRTDTINVFPLIAPKSPIQGGQLHFLEDLAAIAGTHVFNPMTRPLDIVTVDDLSTGVESFEATRFRSTVIGHANEDMLLERVGVLQASLGAEESILERTILEERIGKLTGGIARLKVIGSSNGELREKKDRAEDAVCAVRGAIKHGCLPGGGWTLLALCHLFENKNDPILKEVLRPALARPVEVLLENAGLNAEERTYVAGKVFDMFKVGDYSSTMTYDVMQMHHVEAFASGILDSTPAVREALRNSISIASLLGTLGCAIVFPRDDEMQKERARSVEDFNNSIARGDEMAKDLE